MEEKPRHERILEKMRDLVKKEVSKFSINGEGKATAQGERGKFLLSGSSSGSVGNVDVDPTYDLTQPPLKKIGDEFSVVIGTVNGVIPAINTSGSGYVPIYGTGASGSVPTISNANAEVWAKCTVSPTSIFLSDPGPPASYDIGNMQVSFVEIVTTPYLMTATETWATFTELTGAVTAGTYFYWICSILDGEVILSTALSVRVFLPNGYGSATNYGALTAGLYEAGVGNPDPDVTYI